MALMKFDQVGLPAGVPGFARQDGIADAVVTLTDCETGGITQFDILWAHDEQSSETLHATTDPRVWEFTPADTDGEGNPIRVQLTHTDQDGVVSKQVRIFGIQSAAGVVPPAPGELADPTASLLNATDPAVIDRCERNWPTPKFPHGNPFGWSLDAVAIIKDAATPLSTITPASVGVVGHGGESIAASRADHVHPHGNLPGESLHATATPDSPGFMSSIDKSKLNTIEPGAQLVTEPRVRAALSVASADLTFNGRRLLLVADPVDAQDAATRRFVEQSVRPPIYTTTERLALAPIGPLTVFDSTTKRLHTWDGIRWHGRANPREILRGRLVADWDVLHGVVARRNDDPPKWRDRIQGRVLTGFNSPVFATDGWHFGQMPVWKFSSASSQYMDTGPGDALVQAGSRYVYVSFVFRAPLIASTLRVLVDIRNNAFDVDDGIQARHTAAGAGWRSRIAGLDVSDDVPHDKFVHLWETWLDNGVWHFALDGVLIGATGSDGAFGVPMQRVSIGGFPAAPVPIAFADLHLARLRICTEPLNVDERAALFELDRLMFGFDFFGLPLVIGGVPLVIGEVPLVVV